MKNSKITWKITQGMYVLTVGNGGCIVDAVSQVSGDENPIISVAVMKKNNTNALMKENNFFALSVLPKNVDGNIIKTFGFASSRDINKFEKIETTEVMGVKTIKDSIGYMVLEKVYETENTTHTLFLGRLAEGDIMRDEEPMSYGYYKDHKDELLKVTTEDGKTAWVCTVCGYVYYGEEVPDDYVCPVCGVDKSYFEKQEA